MLTRNEFVAAVVAKTLPVNTMGQLLHFERRDFRIEENKGQDSFSKPCFLTHFQPVRFPV
jgi:hypothetical protein